MNAADALRSVAPSIGFPLTICVVCYGSNAPLAGRFLESLYRFTDPSLFSLWAGLNAVESETERRFRAFRKEFANIELTVSRKNLFKAAMMRRLLYDNPIASRWTIWCDDDTYFTKPDWLQNLALKMELCPDTPMWGRLHLVWTREKETLDWVRAATWYRGRPFRKGNDLNGKRAVEFCFATGGFWAIKTDLLYKLNWPDPRLVQGGDDFMLGEALRQNGYKIGNFKHGVAINAADRRNPDAPEHSLIRV